MFFFIFIKGRDMSFLFKAGNLLDPRKGELVENVDILIEEGVVREVSDRPLSSSTAQVIDLHGKVIMPGLIDCHKLGRTSCRERVCQYVRIWMVDAELKEKKRATK